MTVLDRVVQLLTQLGGKPICDDCIAQRLELTVRQHANHKSRELAEQPGFDREVGRCSDCDGLKKVIRRLA